MNILTPTFEDTMRYGRGYNRTASGRTADHSLCGSITRGIGYRNLAGRLAAIGGGAKPYDREVEYLESHGTEYIDTGYGLVDGSCSLELKACRCNIYGGNALCGSEYSGGTARWTFVLFPQRGDYMLYPLNRNWNNGSFCFDYSAYKVNTLKWISENNKEVCEIFETGEKISASSNTSYTSENFYLFRNTTSQFSKARIYYVKLWYGSEISRDLIPVLATFDGVQEACFYNRAYKTDGSNGLQFYRNAGTGRFTTDLDVV